MTESFQAWLDAHEGDDWHWYIKRLSANDTLATKAHQAGTYVPNNHAFLLFPSLVRSNDPNPKVVFQGAIDSHNLPSRELTITWYRAAKNECRITRWGGTKSPVLDPESTGSVAVFAFFKPDAVDASYLAVWLCDLREEELLMERTGPIEPGFPLFVSKLSRVFFPPSLAASCRLTPSNIPAAWLTEFPSGDDIIAKCIELRPLRDKYADVRLLERRKCEFEIFRSVEELHVLPRLQTGFPSVDDFIEYSNSVNNRRKSRSGRSLELQARGIFEEEDVSFSHGKVSEGNKKPDFLFPSSDAYGRAEKPLWMLAAKTTCKDRWRQILNEADLIPNKHLLTLQEGVSINQYQEMKNAGVTLVVPTPLHRSYPEEIRDELMAFRTFIAMVKCSTSR